MKMSVKVAIASAVLALGMTGCGELITVEKQDNGALAYLMNFEVSLPIKEDVEYRGFDIDSYYMDFKELNGMVTVEVRHHVTFTIGSGAPNNGTGSLTDWMPSEFYDKPSSFDIVGLTANMHTPRKQKCSFIITSCSESVKTQYTKKEFVEFFKNAKNAQVKIRYGNEEKVVNIPSMDKIKKYANCLADRSACVSK